MAFSKIITYLRLSSSHLINKKINKYFSTTIKNDIRSINNHDNYNKPINDDHEIKETHFGYQTVKENEKSDKVRDVFVKVADSYDVMNDAMSLGIHRVWKDVLVQRLGPTPGTRLLDVAGGTGDIAFRYLNYIEKIDNPLNLKSHVTIYDINDSMLKVGKNRASDIGWNNSEVSWQQGDAEKLPFDDEAFTAYTIAFGIRNVTRIENVLAEAYRVLKPGGRFLCLEFSQPNNEALRWVYDKYSFQMIPVMGMLIAGQWQPYQYLVESIRKFPRQEDFQCMIEDAGFREVNYENLTFGIVAIHSGFKL